MAAPPTITIAPGVEMPYVSLGFGSGQKGDVVNATELWLHAGGVGIDTAYDYGNQAEIAAGLAAAGAKRSDVFITTKIPCASYNKAQTDIDADLKQLNVEQVDLLLIHNPRCGFGASVAETWKAVKEVTMSRKH